MIEVFFIAGGIDLIDLSGSEGFDGHLPKPEGQEILIVDGSRAEDLL